MRDKVDTLIVVSNDQLLKIVPENTPLTEAFLVADDILRQGVVGISEIIIKPGLVNVDFADVRAIMGNAGNQDNSVSCECSHISTYSQLLLLYRNCSHGYRDRQGQDARSRCCYRSDIFSPPGLPHHQSEGHRVQHRRGSRYDSARDQQVSSL